MATSRQPSRLRFFVIPIIVIVALVWSIVAGWWGQALRPWLGLSWWQAHPSALTNVASASGWQHQVELLSHQVADLQQQLDAQGAIKNLQDFTASSHHHLIMSPLTSVNPDSGIFSLTLARGSSDGVHVGQVVVTPAGTVIGKITVVHPHTAVALLLSDSQSVIAAKVVNAQNSPGVVRGERGLSLQMEFIPKTDPIQVGQVIVTSGTEQGIPAGLVIGTLQHISTRSGDVFQNAALVWPVDVAQLDIVGVVTQ